VKTEVAKAIITAAQGGAHQGQVSRGGSGIAGAADSSQHGGLDPRPVISLLDA